MKFSKLSILLLCLLSSLMCYADDGIAVAGSGDGYTSYTYTRSGVKADSWESFCLPMNIDIDELQSLFDEVYIPYNGETYNIYDDVPETSGETEKEGSTLPSGKSATSRYCFAYNATGSTYYHFYIADFSSEASLVIPQGTPLFAHVKSSFPNGTLTIDGFLETGETAKTGLVDKSFSVYSNQTLQTLATDKGLHVIGSLSVGDTYSGTLYTITGKTNTSEATTVEQYHAYLTGTGAEGILIYPTTCKDLETLVAVTPQLHLSDSFPTLVTETYKAGNIDYTRTVNNYYAGFYVPFDIDLSAMTDNFKEVYTLAGFAIYNPDNSIMTTFYNKYTSSTLPAYTPFLAVMNTDGEGNKKSQNVCLKASTETELTSTADKDPVAMKVYDYNFTDGALATTSTNYAVSYGGSLNATYHAQSEGYHTPNGKDAVWGYIDGTLKAFREYIIITSLASSAKPVTMEVSFINETTGIEDVIADRSNDALYDISGRKIQYHNSNSIPKGIYITNGKKFVRK